MLKEKSEEKFLVVFFAVTLVIMFYLSINKMDILDISYSVVIISYFIKFLVNRKN